MYLVYILYYILYHVINLSKIKTLTILFMIKFNEIINIQVYFLSIINFLSHEII